MLLSSEHPDAPPTAKKNAPFVLGFKVRIEPRLLCISTCEASLVFLCSESVDQVVEKYGLQKITLLREISVKAGIQVGPF